MRVPLAIFAGGALGAALRAAVSEGVGAPGGSWPWATFLVNVAGAGVLGWAAVRFAGHKGRRALLGPGLCGGLTTFSTLQLELVRQLGAGSIGLALGYAAGTLATGYLALLGGARLAR